MNAKKLRVEWKTETAEIFFASTEILHRHRYNSKFNYNNGFYYFQFYVTSIVLFYIASQAEQSARERGFFPFGFYSLLLLFLDDFISRPDARDEWQRNLDYIRILRIQSKQVIKTKGKWRTMKNVLQIANVLIMSKTRAILVSAL